MNGERTDAPLRSGTCSIVSGQARSLFMRDILTDSQTALWVDLVHEAEHDAAAPLGEELESYLVFLLIAHMRDTQLHRNAIANDYLLAKTQAGKRHREELRAVSDRCLLLAGLYP